MSNHIARAIAILLVLPSVPLSPSGRTAENEDVLTLVPGFRQVVIDPGYPGGDCRAIGDMNGDGKPDVLAASKVELAWYEYPSWKKHRIAMPREEFTTDMQAADVDGDGDLDVIVPDGGNGSVAWYENPRPRGSPGAASWEQHIIGLQGTWAHDLEIGDINRDGKLDVVTRKGNAHEPGETIVWLQDDPDRWTRVVIPTAARGEGAAIADINGDGRPDLIQNGCWLECPADATRGDLWVRHMIAPDWPDMVGVTVADMNEDNRPDVLLAPAESHGRLAWYESPRDPVHDPWTEYVIDSDVDFIHTFKVGDINNDGRLDVVTAEMQQSGYHPEIHSRARVSVYFNDFSGRWRHVVLATTGGHNLRIGDIGADGDIDIVSANWGGPHHLLEMWENELIDPARLSFEKGWQYIEVDSARRKWGDFDPPPWLKYFGIAWGDVNRDGYMDLASGRYFYRNPGGTMTGHWQRVDFGLNVDAMLMTDVDGDGQADAIAEALPGVYWLKPLDRDGGTWSHTLVGNVPATDHVNGQGYALGQLEPGPKPQVILATGRGIYYFRIPPHPESGNWPLVHVTGEASDEGLAVGDVNGDSRPDILTAFGKDGNQIAWCENPGDGSGNWKPHVVGRTEYWADRKGLADLNSDGRLDIVVSEERWPEIAPATLYWFEQPADDSGKPWHRHVIATEYTLNSMDVADMTGDGVPDIVVNEHRGMRRLQIWENVNHGASWREHLIDAGKEGHLGARVADLDGDGQPEILSIAWDTYPCLRMWHKLP
jgi:hypothetical protein